MLADVLDSLIKSENRIERILNASRRRDKPSASSVLERISLGNIRLSENGDMLVRNADSVSEFLTSLDNDELRFLVRRIITPRGYNTELIKDIRDAAGIGSLLSTALAIPASLYTKEYMYIPVLLTCAMFFAVPYVMANIFTKSLELATDHEIIKKVEKSNPEAALSAIEKLVAFQDKLESNTFANKALKTTQKCADKVADFLFNESKQEPKPENRATLNGLCFAYRLFRAITFREPSQWSIKETYQPWVKRTTTNPSSEPSVA